MQQAVGKTYSEYASYIKRQLGILCKDSFEFSNEDLKLYIDDAFSEVQPYISARNRVTLPWIGKANGAIKLEEDYKIRAVSVTAVKRGTEQGYLNTGSIPIGSWTTTVDGTYPDIPTIALGGGFYCYGWGYGLNNDPWITEKLLIKGVNEAAGDGHFVFDYGKQLLFINFNERIPKSVTIDYTPELRTVEDITDSYWIQLMKKYALAKVKLALSQYRGIYSSVEGSPFKLDYQRLQTEGERELAEVKEILESNLLNYRFD